MGVDSGGRCDDRFRVLASLPEVIKYVEILGPHKPAYSQDEADDIGFCLLNFRVIDDFSGVNRTRAKSTPYPRIKDSKLACEATRTE